MSAATADRQVVVRDWVKLDEWCRRKGDTPDAVHARRRKRQWIDQVHCVVGPDGNLYVCPEEVNRWIQGLPPRQLEPED